MCIASFGHFGRSLRIVNYNLIVMKHTFAICLILSLLASCRESNPVINPTQTCGVTTFTDASGNVYSTVSIGTKCWFALNLKTTKFNNGDSIAEVQSVSTWASTSNPAFCAYNNDSAQSALYGNLYNYIAIADPRGVCPTGSHVATDADWNDLGTVTGGMMAAGGNLKEVGTLNWASPNTAATDNFDFTALPGGFRTYVGIFSNVKYFGKWWTSTDSTSTNSISYYMKNDSGILYRDFDDIHSGFSIRCVVD